MTKEDYRSIVPACTVWRKLDEDVDGSTVHPPLFGVATQVGAVVSRHVTVNTSSVDLDVVALDGEIVKSLRF